MGGLALGGVQVYYEVLGLYGERWLIDFVLPERDAALEEASHLLGRRGVAGVKVRKEVFDPEHDRVVGLTIFRQLRPRHPAGPRRCLRPPPEAEEPTPLRRPVPEPRIEQPLPETVGARRWPGALGLTLAAGTLLLVSLALASVLIV